MEAALHNANTRKRKTHPGKLVTLLLMPWAIPLAMPVPCTSRSKSLENLVSVRLVVCGPGHQDPARLEANIVMCAESRGAAGALQVGTCTRMLAHSNCSSPCNPAHAVELCRLLVIAVLDWYAWPLDGPRRGRRAREGLTQTPTSPNGHVSRHVDAVPDVEESHGHVLVRDSVDLAGHERGQGAPQRLLDLGLVLYTVGINEGLAVFQDPSEGLFAGVGGLVIATVQEALPGALINQLPAPLLQGRAILVTASHLRWQVMAVRVHVALRAAVGLALLESCEPASQCRRGLLEVEAFIIEERRQHSLDIWHKNDVTHGEFFQEEGSRHAG
mmetsp:Transcript_111728/g.356511  ORF Transcript_111728/g.356511 Transcript_111728/m.356511 type:complete len:329 (-) Transcript_111728:595-1581(-)